MWRMVMMVWLLIAWPALGQEGLLPGMMAPEFALPDGEGKLRDIREWRGKWLVLYFYPKDNTPGCTAEALAFQDNLENFRKLNAEVVGISLDDGASHRDFASERRLSFTLLSDRDGTVSRRYGALSALPFVKFAKRHTFLVGPDGRLVRIYREVDPTRHAMELLADLRGIREK